MAIVDNDKIKEFHTRRIRFGRTSAKLSPRSPPPRSPAGPSLGGPTRPASRPALVQQIPALIESFVQLLEAPTVVVGEPSFSSFFQSVFSSLASLLICSRTRSSCIGHLRYRRPNTYAGIYFAWAPSVLLTIAIDSLRPCRPGPNVRPGGLPQTETRTEHSTRRGALTMPVTILVGTQWGDEGKGKATDLLAARDGLSSSATRAGTTPGHTVVAGDGDAKLHLVPRASSTPDMTPVIGNGVVVDPKVLLEEMDELRGAGIERATAGARAERAPDHAVPPGARPGDRAVPRQARSSARRSGASARRTRTRRRGSGCACRT